MNIKGIVNSVLPIGTREVEKKDKAIKSDSTHDRDANGQQFHGGQEEHKRPMTPEELKKALEHLKSLAVVKDHNLRLEVREVDNRKFVFLIEPSGKVIRRIPEAELWTLQVMKDSDKGQLIRKTA